MNPIKTLIAVTFVAFATVLAFVSAQTPDAGGRSETSVYRFEDASEIDGSSSQLIRTDDTVAVDLTTVDLEPLTPYTLWWVVFNTPQGCSGACGEDDIFAADGSMSLNPDATISILFADGALSDAEGNGSFSALLTEGRALGEVLAGPGLTDAIDAEVHLVVRDHGQLDAGTAWNQLTTFQGDCSSCADAQFAVHQPAFLNAGN